MANQTAQNQRQQGRDQKREMAGGEGGELALQPLDDVIAAAREYIREQPEMAALWCLGIGFVLGWKLKPW